MDIFGISWGVAIVLHIVIASGLTQYVLKTVVGKGRRTERYLWQFIFTFLIAMALSFSLGGFALDGAFLSVVAIGFIAGAGSFFAWKAMAISQSRSALFNFWDDIIAMVLAYLILDEGKFLTPLISFGIALSLLAIAGLIWYGYKKKEQSGRVPIIFYGYVIMYSLVWGVATFGQRYWSFNEMPVPTFLAGWYSGTLIIAILIFMFYHDATTKEQDKHPLALKDIVSMFGVAVLILVSLGLASIAYRAPQVIVQPIFFVSEMIVPTLIGLFLFHERKQLKSAEWLFFLIAGAGALLVGLNF